MNTKTCTECGKAPVHARGWCLRHYRRWSRTGQLKVTRRRRTPMERYQARESSCTVLDGECLIWTGAKTLDGYGIITDEGPPRTSVYVHRLAHEWHIGPIPEGYQVDHLCYNTNCVLPAHLEAVEPQVNRDRMRVGRDPASGRFTSTITRERT